MTSLPWTEDLRAAKASAKESGKLLLTYVYSPG